MKLFGTETNAEGHKFVSTGQQCLIVSMLSVGTFFGALSGATIGDIFGRRLGLLSTQEPPSTCLGRTKTNGLWKLPALSSSLASSCKLSQQQSRCSLPDAQLQALAWACYPPSYRCINRNPVQNGFVAHSFRGKQTSLGSSCLEMTDCQLSDIN